MLAHCNCILRTPLAVAWNNLTAASLRHSGRTNNCNRAGNQGIQGVSESQCVFL
jgi:hypothetical protein